MKINIAINIIGQINIIITNIVTINLIIDIAINIMGLNNYNSNN